MAHCHWDRLQSLNRPHIHNLAFFSIDHLREYSFGYIHKAFDISINHGIPIVDSLCAQGQGHVHCPHCWLKVNFFPIIGEAFHGRKDSPFAYIEIEQMCFTIKNTLSSSSRSWRLPHKIKRSPRWANKCAVALPMPLVAPVIVLFSFHAF